MKKIIAVTAIIIASLTLFVSCNKSYGFGNYSFKKVHVDTHNGSCCLTVEKWYDAETGVEVKTKEAGALFLSEGTYIMIEDECPFCVDND